MKVVFLISDVKDNHYRNRILDFITEGCEVEVYAFRRDKSISIRNLPYSYHIIGSIKNASYKNRVNMYVREFRKIGKKHGNKAVYFLGGLDIAIFFHFLNPTLKYIFEECDMVHLYHRSIITPILERISKYIIRHSVATITTSEGFMKYHYGEYWPSNVILVANKLNNEILNCPPLPKKTFNPNHISIGFVGVPRSITNYLFIDYFCKNYPQHSFHIFGAPLSIEFEQLKKYDNCLFHGRFKNPEDLPIIYSKIDALLCAYDYHNENNAYAEPNKLYEAICFEKPFIVSSHTFLGEKVRRLGIGLEVDCHDETDINRVILSLTKENVSAMQHNAHSMDKNITINDSKYFLTIKHLYEKNSK